MIKKTALFLGLIALSFSNYAQEKIDINLIKSNLVTEARRGTFLVNTVSDENGGVVVLKAVQNTLGLYIKSYIIERYDSDLKLIKKVSIPNKMTQRINNMYVKDDVLYLIKQQVSKKIGFQFFGMSAAIKDLKFKTKLLYTLARDKANRVVNAPFSQRIDNDGFGGCTLSKNYNFFALSFDLRDKAKKEKHLFLLFDAQMNKVDEITFVSDETDRVFKYSDIKVSDKDGTIFLMGVVYENNRIKSKVKNTSNYHYDLYKLKGTDKTKISIKESKYFLNWMSMVYNDDSIILLGFFGNKNLKHNIGAFRYDLTEDLTIKNKSLKLFPNQLFSDRCSKCKDLKASKKKLTNLTIRSIYVDDNQNAVINAEQFYIKYTYGKNGEITKTTYHYDDIVTLKFDNKGKILWARNINKSQKGVKNTSFSALVANGKNYIFLNAGDKVIERENDVIAFRRTSAKKSNLYVIMVDGNGKLKYKKIIDDKESKVWYVVSSGIANTKEKTIIFEGNKGKLRRLAKIKVD